MKVAIIGCGSIGRKRAAACKALGHDIVAAGDIILERATQFAADFGGPECEVATDRGVMSMHPCPDAFIICTPHADLAPIARCCTSRGAHVFLEKPGARRADELTDACINAAKHGVIVRVGFNLRYHSGIQQALDWLPEIGKLMYLKGYYGHGGRVGFETEWRMKRWLSGGGVGMDMMPHLIDLCQLFAGQQFEVNSQFGHTEFWKAPVEDNLWMQLRGDGVHAHLHASWTEWRNKFLFELIGATGKIVVDGIGGSYGVETATLYIMSIEEMGPPQILSREYPGEDRSWKWEMRDFFDDIALKRRPSCGIPEAQAVLRILEEAGYCIPAGATPETV